MRDGFCCEDAAFVDFGEVVLKFVRVRNDDAVDGEAILFFVEPRCELAEPLIHPLSSVVVGLNVVDGRDDHWTMVGLEMVDVLARQHVGVAIVRVFQYAVEL